MQAATGPTEAAAALPAPPSLLALEKTPPLTMVDAETLARGLQQLQERIPGFTQLSIRERRSMARTAYLDPEFVAAGSLVSQVWDKTEVAIGRDREELRRDLDEARFWEDAERVAEVVFKGIAAMNLERRHRIGRDILNIYFFLGRQVRRSDAESVRLRPHFDEMKRLYIRTLNKKKRKTPQPARSSSRPGISAAPGEARNSNPKGAPNDAAPVVRRVRRTTGVTN